VLNRPSPVASRPFGMGMWSAVVVALQAARIRLADPATGFFEPYHLGFPLARVAGMAVGAAGSSREMEPQPGFASTSMHAPMPWGQPCPAAPNSTPPVAPLLVGRHRHRLQPFAPSVPRLSTTASTPCHPTAAMTLAPPSSGFGVRPPGPHAGTGATLGIGVDAS
jgi:hypothetical protein